MNSVDYSSQNVAVLSILLALALIANLSAFPVILFRRTRLKDNRFHSLKTTTNIFQQIWKRSVCLSHPLSHCLRPSHCLLRAPWGAHTRGGFRIQIVCDRANSMEENLNSFSLYILSFTDESHKTNVAGKVVVTVKCLCV